MGCKKMEYTWTGVYSVIFVVRGIDHKAAVRDLKKRPRSTDNVESQTGSDSEVRSFYSSTLLQFYTWT